MPQFQMELPFVSRDLAEIDTILDRAITAGNPLIATEYGNQLTRSITIKGVALAKLLYGIRSNWPLFRAAGIEEDFLDFINAHMGLTAQTADKYANMYETVFEKAEIDPAIKEQLATKPIQSLLLLTAAVREGTLGEEELSDVVLKDHSGIRSMVRQARGDSASSGTAIFAVLMRGNGSHPPGAVVVYGPEGETEVIGILKLEPDTISGQKYMERLRNKMGLEVR